MHFCKLSKIKFVYFIFLILNFSSLSLAESFNRAHKLLTSRFDPFINYYTITTDNFYIHYSEELEQLAYYIAPIAENSLKKLSKKLNIKDPPKTNIVLLHQSDQPNIFTFVCPHNQIFFDVALPPTNLGMNNYAKWHEWIIVHELTHVLHLEHTNGYSNFLSPLFGSFLRPNQLTPLWMKEGLATFMETNLTPQGRGSGTTYPMMMRMAFHENLFKNGYFAAPETISSFDNQKWPWTNRPYIMGYYLVNTIYDKNDQNLHRLINETAENTPYKLDTSIQNSTGKTFNEIWNKTLINTELETKAQIEKIKSQKLTKIDYLTDNGQIHHGLTISPDGKSLFVTRDQPNVENAIVRIDLSQNKNLKYKLLPRSTGYQSSISKSGRFLAFDQVAKSKRYYMISDIYLLDLKTNKVISVSPYLRARDPDIHPNGENIVMVVNSQGKNKLIITDTEWRTSKDILGDIGYRRLSGPRFSPDGKKIVVSVTDEEKGAEDLWLIQDEKVKVIVSNSGKNIHPSWSSDGKWILYSSDYSGVANIYAYEVEKNKTYQLTNVLGGAFYPVVDNKKKWIYITSYRGKGYDVARFQWNPKNWIRVASKDFEIKDSTTQYTATELMQKSEYEFSKTTYTSKNYILPQYLRPTILLRPNSWQFGFEFGSTDPLFFQEYSLNFRFDSSTNQPVGELFYFNGMFPWAFDLSLNQDAIPVRAISTNLKTLGLRSALNIPINEEGDFHLRPGFVYQEVEVTTRDSFYGEMLGLKYDTQFQDVGNSFPDSGAYFELNAINLKNVRKSNETSVILETSFEVHSPMKWNHHVIHWGLNGGAYLSTKLGAQSFFTAGGIASFPYTLDSNFTLYGYAPNSLNSTQVTVGNFLYTFPLKEIQRGWSIHPLYFGRLSGGLRLQTSSFKDISPSGNPGSVGIELHQALLIGHLLDLSAQLGLYQGDTKYGGETQFIFKLTSSTK